MRTCYQGTRLENRHGTASLVLAEGTGSFHSQVVVVFEPLVGDASDDEAYGNEGVMVDVDHNRPSVHMGRHLAHREAKTQNLEDIADMGSLRPPCAGDVGGDHTSRHDEGDTLVGNPGRPPPLSTYVPGGDEDSAHFHTSHWHPWGRVRPPPIGAISLLRGKLQRRQPLPGETPCVHRTAQIAHHTHTAAALLGDKACEGGAEENMGEGIPPRTLLPDSNRPQGGGGGRRTQRHWGGRRRIRMPSLALLLCFLLLTLEQGRNYYYFFPAINGEDYSAAVDWIADVFLLLLGGVTFHHGHGVGGTRRELRNEQKLQQFRASVSKF